MTMHLPEEFTAYTRSLMGSERYLQLIEGLAAEPSASIRLNPFKASLDKVEVPLADTPVPTSRSTHSSMQAFIMFRKPLPCSCIMC